MIPKIIHYCWLSGDPYPEKEKVCMNSWEKYLSDYEFILWDLKRFDINSSDWVKQAYKNKKYAFAADYIRLYALYNYGGIYLDTDVEVVKSFDELLSLPYFVGKEVNDYWELLIELGAFGAEKGCTWVANCLDYYKNRDFEYGFGKYNTTVLPLIMNQILSKKFYLLPIQDLKSFQYDKNTICILPGDWFCAKHSQTKIITNTMNTYCIHHFSNSWMKLNLKQKIRQRISIVVSLLGILSIYRKVFPKKYKY